MKQTRREFLRTTGLAVLAGGPLGTLARASLAGGAAKGQPNILLVFPDQHRFDWLGTNKAVPVRTPNIDKLSARGVRFADALCPAPVCAPSRACLASGKEYDRCGVRSNGVNYPLQQETFYKLLRETGYFVAGCGKFDLAKAAHDWGLDGKRLLNEWGFSDGINSEGKHDAIGSGKVEPRGPYMAYLQKKGLLEIHVADYKKRGSKAAAFPTPLPEEAYNDNWIAGNAQSLIGRFPKDKPWFLQVNFAGPHEPWDITADMEKSCRGLTGFPSPNGCKQFTPEQHVAVRQNYSAMIENIDRWLGAMIDQISKRGELDNTLVVFSSDHGEMLGDHNHWGKTVPWHPSASVPLMLAGPGVRSNFVCTAPAATLDLAATFLDYAGAKIPADMDSRSMRPLLEGKADKLREHVLSGLGNWRLIYDGRYKLIRGFGAGKNRKAGKAAAGAAPADEDAGNDAGVGASADGLVLFDLKNDPLENENIADKSRDVVKRLLPLLPKT